jgi:hypothetical protein
VKKSPQAYRAGETAYPNHRNTGLALVSQPASQTALDFSHLLTPNGKKQPALRWGERADKPVMKESGLDEAFAN